MKIFVITVELALLILLVLKIAQCKTAPAPPDFSNVSSDEIDAMNRELDAFEADL